MDKIEEKFTENKTQSMLVQVLCIECNRPTKHRVVVSLDKDGTQSNDAEEWSIDWVDNYQIIQCQGCDAVTFRHLSWFSEDCHPEFDEPGTTERLYPKRDANTRQPEPFLNVPTILRRIYGELVDCFNNDSPTLCAAGLRALVEGLCAEQGIIDGPVTVPATGGGTQIVRRNNLEGRISGLHEKGLLTSANAQTLHEHRYLGNEAVHQLARPSQEELGLAIDIVEHLLTQVYEIPQKAAELRQSRANRTTRS